ncbi:unnamed protein product [Arctogadus glacialis]
MYKTCNPYVCKPPPRAAPTGRPSQPPLSTVLHERASVCHSELARERERERGEKGEEKKHWEKRGVINQGRKRPERERERERKRERRELTQSDAEWNSKARRLSVGREQLNTPINPNYLNGVF